MNVFFSIYRRLGIIRYHLSRNEIVIVLAAGGLLLLAGTVVYSILEGWSLLDSLYFTVVTMTTVGYGDLSPDTAYGRFFAIFFTIIAIGIGGYAITVLAAYVIENQSNKLDRILRKRKMERIDTLRGHMIICGTDIVGFRIARDYKLADIPFILIEPDEEKLKLALLLLIPEYYQNKIDMLTDVKEVDLSEYEDRTVAELAEMVKVPYLLDDPTDDHVLWKAGVEHATGLITVMSDDRDNLSIIIGARTLGTKFGNRALRIMGRSDELKNIRKMYFSGADEVRSPASIGGGQMALHLAHPEISNWWKARIHGKTKTTHFEQVEVGEKRPLWINKTVGEIHISENILIMAIKREDQYLSPPPADTKIQATDIAITYGNLEGNAA